MSRLRWFGMIAAGVIVTGAGLIGWQIFEGKQLAAGYAIQTMTNTQNISTSANPGGSASSNSAALPI